MSLKSRFLFFGKDREVKNPNRKLKAGDVAV